MYKTTEVLYELQGKIQAQKDVLKDAFKSIVYEESKDYRIYRMLYTHTLGTYDVINELIDVLIGVIKDKQVLQQIMFTPLIFFAPGLAWALNNIKGVIK